MSAQIRGTDSDMDIAPTHHHKRKASGLSESEGSIWDEDDISDEVGYESTGSASIA